MRVKALEMNLISFIFGGVDCAVQVKGGGRIVISDSRYAAETHTHREREKKENAIDLTHCDDEER
jgi:hypothetical protein